jgi:hypothetical protein
MEKNYRCTAAKIVLACAVALAGCCGGKVTECNKLVAVINSNGEAIKKATDRMNTSKNDTTTIEDLAKAMDQAANEIKAVDVKDDTLAGYRQEYFTMLDSGAKSARSMVSAAKKNDSAALNKAMADISAVEGAESTLVTRVNTYCSK